MQSEKLKQFRELVEEVHEILSKQKERLGAVDKGEVERAACLCMEAAEVLDQMDGETSLKLVHHGVLKAR